MANITQHGRIRMDKLNKLFHVPYSGVWYYLIFV